MVNVIVAVARNGAIGYQGRLLYGLPNDLKRFKALTTGHVVIMGRKTFESLPKGALPNRRNLVLSHRNTTFPGTECFGSLAEALQHCQPEEQIFVIGGASVYREAMAYADRLYVTWVDDTPSVADVFFPSIDSAEWREVSRETHVPDDRHAYPYTFIDYVRRDGTILRPLPPRCLCS